jgi:hypothetical protein
VLFAVVVSGVLLVGVGYALLEQRKIREIRLEGVQHLSYEELERSVRAALNERSFIGVQRWYSHTIEPKDIVRHLPEGQVEVTSVKRAGDTLVVALRETVVRAAQQQEDGWHLLGNTGQTLGIASEPPGELPRIYGPVRPETLTFLTDINNILRRNDEAALTELHCDEESNGAWCSLEHNEKMILFSYNAAADQILQTTQELHARSEKVFDLRFGQRIYLR